jgi:hypothetical protein
MKNLKEEIENACCAINPHVRVQTLTVPSGTRCVTLDVRGLDVSEVHAVHYAAVNVIERCIPSSNRWSLVVTK